MLINGDISRKKKTLNGRIFMSSLKLKKLLIETNGK